MRKIVSAILVLSAFLTFATGALATAQFQVLAPAEESFIGMDQILIIGKVDGFNEAKMVEISSNGKAMGFAPLQNGSFTFKTKLADGRHEITLAAPGVDRRTIKIFVGKQKGYRYHIEPDMGYCVNCHSKAGTNVFKVQPMQGDLCKECHDPVGLKEFVHGPVAASSCTPCHDPHGSRYDKFLVAVGKELCLVCHSQNLSKRHIEERQNSDCMKCHDPHSSDKEYHLF
jgi:predicted CXXCH cytochrome family protein